MPQFSTDHHHLVPLTPVLGRAAEACFARARVARRGAGNLAPKVFSAAMASSFFSIESYRATSDGGRRDELRRVHGARWTSPGGGRCEISNRSFFLILLLFSRGAWWNWDGAGEEHGGFVSSTPL